MTPTPGTIGGTTSYAYRAARMDGVVERGVISAESREAALRTLRGRGVLPLDVGEVSSRGRHGRRFPPMELALGLRILSDLLGAGLPMARALVAFEELAPPAWRGGLDVMRSAVREGHSLASALQESGLSIPPLVIGVIQAGEAGGGLAAAVRRAADCTEMAATTRMAIRGALMYPIVLSIAGAAVMTLLVAVVLPRFAAILAGLGQSLPPTTRIVLGVAAAVRLWAVPGAIGVMVMLLVWRGWTATPSGRQHWDELLLAIPGIGAIRHAMATAHAMAALASLLESGVPLPVALQHAARATGDGALSQRLLAARERVLTGQRIGVALAETRAVTPTGIRLVRAGEDTGRLAAMLQHAATLEGDRAQQLVKGAVRLIEPGLILIFGATIAFVAAALLQAVYSVRPGGVR